MKKRAFSFLEIIVSIVIMWILLSASTIAIKKWMITSRDVDRSTSLTLISNWLKQYMYDNDFYPVPENSLAITASGDQNIVWYQWYFNDNVAMLLNMRALKDPTDGNYYTYCTNWNSNMFSIMWYFERNQYSMVDKVYADTINYNWRYPSIKWDKVWVLVNLVDNKPLQEVFSGRYDLLLWSQNLKVFFSDESNYNLSGSKILSIKAMHDQSLTKYDTWLVGYRDMSTLTNSGATMVLKDLSKYGNNWACYNSWDVVSCGYSRNGPQITNSQNGKGMAFDGVDDSIKWNFFSGSMFSGWATLCAYTKKTNDTDARGNVFLGESNTLQLRYNSRVEDSNSYWEASLNIASSWEPRIKSNYSSNNHEMVFVCYTWNTQVQKIYINWKLMNSAARTGALFENSVKNYYIWWMVGSSYNYFLGWVIDEIRVYNRALSEFEIQSLSYSHK